MSKQRYFNLNAGTDTYPYELVNVISDKTVEIRRMNATLDPSFKPEVHVGGFSAHVSNQHDQKWNYESDEKAGVIRVQKRRKQKKVNGKPVTEWIKKGSVWVESDRPIKFHDYNF